MNISYDRVKAERKWSPILESLGVKNEEKREWLTEMAEYHQTNENASGLSGIAYSNNGNIGGMGAVVSPQPGTTPGAYGTQGSGDIGVNLLPVAMKIAAQAIGLELVKVKPVASPKVDLIFLDMVYDNYDETTDKPLVFKVAGNTAAETAVLTAALTAKLTTAGISQTVGGLTDRLFYNFAANTATATTEPATKTGILEFLGFSRITGQPMFRTFRQVLPGSTAGGYPTFDATKNTFGANDIISTVLAAGAGSGLTGLTVANISLISLLDDEIPGYVANWNLTTPMNRAEDETTYAGVVGPNLYTESIQIGTIAVKTSLKRTQMEDIKSATGIDIVQRMESVLVNELTQKVSKDIVAKVQELGELNRSTPSGSAAVGEFDFDVTAYVASLAGAGMGETSQSIQRKLITKINGASNYIASEGRVGPAQYIVTNGKMAGVLQDIANYQISPSPLSPKLNASSGQLYPVGTIGQIAIYVDPYQSWNDNRLFLGRKNNEDQPGLLFLPYLMAQSISLISEGTFSHTMLIRSRYSISKVGFNPQKSFYAIHVTDTNKVLS